MKTPDIRVPQKPFIDRQHFPYGFKKSGDFSITEANLLSQYGKTLAGLESGELTPETADEAHFVAMLYTLHSTASNQSDYDDDYSDDEFDVA